MILNDESDQWRQWVGLKDLGGSVVVMTLPNLAAVVGGSSPSESSVRLMWTSGVAGRITCTEVPQLKKKTSLGSKESVTPW